MQKHSQLELIKRIKALSETGLVYSESAYDLERYAELKEISLLLMASVVDSPLKVLKDLFRPVIDYPTPKVDVRGLVLNNNNELLMARESIDGKWTIPGGWADVGYSPSEVVVKEIEEETGLKSETVRLLAIYDKRCHEHPPQPYYIYKLIFLCKILEGNLKAGFDMMETAYFSINDLPELSEDRILKSQLLHLYELANNDQMEVYFD